MDWKIIKGVAIVVIVENTAQVLFDAVSQKIYNKIYPQEESQSEPCTCCYCTRKKKKK